MSARDDYPYIELGPQRDQWSAMCDEIDRLRTLDDLADVLDEPTMNLIHDWLAL